MNNDFSMKDIVDYCQEKGFVYQGSQIYGGLANSWDYGPYGSILKENIKNLWLKHFVQERDDMVMLDSAILMNPNVWKASGHIGGFSDPLIDDKNTGERFRADKLLEDLIEGIENKEEFMKKYVLSNLIPESWTLEKQTEVMRSEKVKNPNNGKEGNWSEAKNFNLMYKTFQGVTEDSSSTIYMRPETAQGIFVNFNNILRTSRRKLPFGVAQVGKAFRNEITPGNFIFRTREFEQMEIEYFCEPGKDTEIFENWKKDVEYFFKEVIGLKEENLRFRDHEQDELSHYSKGTTDVEYKFPFGWGELQGTANRTNYDLNQHTINSNEQLSYFDQEGQKRFIPYVIEPSFGLTRLFLATLCDSYTYDEENDRTVMKFNPEIAPVKVAILPIVKNLKDEAKEIQRMISKEFITEYDDAGKIGKRYRRFDEIGTPICISIDDENLGNDCVVLRHRDTMEQEIVKIDDLLNRIREIIYRY